MTLDVQTLLIVMMINMIALSIALPAIMGWRVSTSARFAQAAMITQTLGWSCLVLASGAWDRAVSVLAMASIALGTALLWQAMQGWLGQRPGRTLVWLLVVLIPLGYGIGFDSYPFRVGWANFGLALQLLTVSAVLLWPAPQASGRWRWIMASSMAALAVATALRGVLGAFYTELYPTLRTPHPVNLVFALLSNLTLVLNAVCFLVAWREEAERALRTLARTDSLTGLLNRRALGEEAAAMIAQAKRHGDPLTLLLIDLDHFKQVNDQRGHDSGDRALVLMSRLLDEAQRRGDLAARWGGEEFCVLLARSGPDAGLAFDRRLRTALAEHAPQTLGFGLGFSAGMASLLESDQHLQQLVQRADKALYAAKAAGRGRLQRGDGSEARLAPPQAQWPRQSGRQPPNTQPAELV